MERFCSDDLLNGLGMKKILIIEDDKVTANIYCNKFRVEGFEVDLAVDGMEGMKALATFKPDVVVTDLMLPKLNGIEVIKMIRSNSATAGLPVIVFTNSFLSTMIQDAWKAGATKCLTKTNCTPKQFIDVINGILAAQLAGPGTPAPVPSGLTAHFEAGSSGATKRFTHPAGGAIQAPQPSDPGTQLLSLNTRHFQGDDADSEVLVQSLLRKQFFENAPKEISHIREATTNLSRPDELGSRPQVMLDLARRLKTLANSAGLLALLPLATMSSAMEAFARELADSPTHLNSSSLRTMAQGVDLLPTLLEQAKHIESSTAFSPSILVVDDEPISRRAVTQALSRADLRAIQLADPQMAFTVLDLNPFDLIFLDVEMPELNGYDLCTKIRALSGHAKTPVIFVTSCADFASRARSTLSGGSDFISKPFLFMEVTVKALVHYFRNQNQVLHAA